MKKKRKVLNKKVILSNLREALEQLVETISDLENEPDYDENAFEAQIQHLYHHLNTAWNARYATDEEYYDNSEETFYIHRAFPADIDMGPVDFSK